MPAGNRINVQIAGNADGRTILQWNQLS